MPLTPDSKYTANGVTVKVYDLTRSGHNPNSIDLPWADLPDKPLGVTIHNTPSISVSGTTMAEQYVRATRNGAMRDVIVHFYVDDVEAWQEIPLTLSGWHAADGDGPGNRKTIAIECIMSGDDSSEDRKSEDNCAKLAAFLLNKYGLTIKDLYKHQDWYPKYCPAYIIPHWDSFKSKVDSYLKALKGGSSKSSSSSSTATKEMYRIRKSWSDTASQIGAYTSLDNAKKACKSGYTVYDNSGKAVYSPSSSSSKSSTKNIDVYYRTYTNERWLPEVKNCNDSNDDGYAGIEHRAVMAFAAKASEGTLRYRAHIVNGGWLGWITKYNLSDWYNGYAGVQSSSIDGIQIELNGVSGYEAKYRVSTTTSDSYLPWVTGLEDYAGIFGKPIDKIQIKIVKK